MQLVVLLAVALAFLLPASAQEMALPRVVISAGGPFVCRDTAMQTFRGSIDLPAEYSGQPLGLVCTNGSLTGPGFNWVRLFLLPDQTDTDLQAGGQPTGRMLVSEESFLKSSQQYIDMTGQLKRGQNRFILEGAGMPGASFAFELRSIGTPELYSTSGSLVSGSQAIAYGRGFSLRAGENTVKMGQYAIPVLASNGNELKFQVPEGFPPGNYQITVAIRNFQSRGLPVTVVAPARN